MALLSTPNPGPLHPTRHTQILQLHACLCILHHSPWFTTETQQPELPLPVLLTQPTHSQQALEGANSWRTWGWTWPQPLLCCWRKDYSSHRPNVHQSFYRFSSNVQTVLLSWSSPHQATAPALTHSTCADFGCSRATAIRSSSMRHSGCSERSSKMHLLLEPGLQILGRSKSCSGEKTF